MQKIGQLTEARPARNRALWLLAIVAVGAGLAYALWGGKSGGPAQLGGAPTPVTTVRVARHDVPIYRRGLGAVQALNTVTLKARIDGALDKVMFTEGQEVKAGDLLAQIDPRPYRAALDAVVAKKAQDEAQLANARRDLVRNEALAKNQYASQQSLDTQRAMVAQLEAALKADQAQIENAEVQLSYTSITAPIDGRIGLRQVDAGNIVHAADPTGLAVLSQLHPISLVFTLPADDLPAISKSMRAGSLSVLAFGRDDKQKLADGTLLTIDSAIDPATGTMRLKATFPNDDEALWPGLFVSAHLLIATERGALTVPAASVQRGPEGFFVYVVQPDSTVAVRAIETLEIGGDAVVVTKGLTDGDQVVTFGQSRLQPGAKVAATDGDRR